MTPITRQWKGRALAIMLVGSGFLSAPVALAQQPVVVSAGPISTSVAVYRDGDGKAPLNLRWLRGYALISEKRRIHLPAGASTVRFEGVADGMIAVSAVVSGLPGTVDEKNRDARLLSPASLLDGSYGNRVRIRRTERATGKVTETEAIVRSAPNKGIVLETQQGIEALHCSGLPETLVYDSVPEGLSDKPSFSIHANVDQAQDAEVTLTYLATGFDWRANYVASVAEDGKSLDLFAWLTVANNNGASFDQTNLLVVAGEPNRTSDFQSLASAGNQPHLNLSCWPAGNTSTNLSPSAPPPPPPPPPAPMAAGAPVMLEMVAARSSMMKADYAVIARQEDLGDLKLYRVPVPVDVSPNGQKQVAMIRRESVPVERIYTGTVAPSFPNDAGEESNSPLSITLRTQNREEDGLGLPLPAGNVAVMQRYGGDELLLADQDMEQKAVGEKVEISAGQTGQLRLTQEMLAASEKELRLRLTVHNAHSCKEQVEILIPRLDGFNLRVPGRLKEKDGGRLWVVAVPANGRAEIMIRYRRQ